MRTVSLIGVAVLLGLPAAESHAQGALAERILSAREGIVRLAYGVREGICGDGATFIRDRSRGEDNFMTFEGNSRTRGRNWREQPCEPGPARIAFTKEAGEITRVRLYVGGEWDAGGAGVVDLGEVAAPAAARALLAVAERDRRAEKAVFAALIADSAVVWPELLAMAKNDRVARSTRKSAVFWLSQAAGDEATKGLAELAEDNAQDREIRDQAVFALSQLPEREGVPVLIRLVRTNRDPQVRRKALFWLGQSDDPRALQLIEEILTRGR